MTRRSGRGPRVTRCREKGCGETIIWCVTSLDKSMPVDVAPVEGGNLRLIPRGRQEPPLAEVVPAAERTSGQKLHISHFATCVKNKNKGRRKPTTKTARASWPADQGALFDPAPTRRSRG